MGEFELSAPALSITDVGFKPFPIARQGANAVAAFQSFFFNGPAPTEIYTLSLHDALPISRAGRGVASASTIRSAHLMASTNIFCSSGDRKSTRLNSSHVEISYAVFCL